MEVLEPSDEACTLLVPFDPPSLIMLQQQGAHVSMQESAGNAEAPYSCTILAIHKPLPTLRQLIELSVNAECCGPGTRDRPVSF